MSDSNNDSNLTTFQRKRLENIKRNNDLLKKLNLSKLSNSITPSPPPTVPRSKKVHKAKKSVKKESKPVQLPTRRSRRLQGHSAPDAEPLKELSSSTSATPPAQELQDVKIIGDLKLSDIIKDEDKISRLSSIKISTGDFFDELKTLQSNTDNEKFMFENFKYSECKVIYDRISALYIHPDKERKIILAGDISGNVGLWNAKDVKEEDEEIYDVDEDVFRFQLFKKNVGRIDCFPNKMEKLAIASYDGFLRSLDLTGMQSDELLQLKNEYGDNLGISDFQFSYSDPNVLYLTTLSGEFTTIDMRENNLKNESIKLRRLADKKIGSMAINPKNSFQISTGSLDRTLKIWDIRKLVKKPDWSQYEDYPSHEIVATYDSRLSVSAVSYSPNDETLVCNGYDDTIRLFDVSDKNLQVSEDLQPKLTLKHNCQSGRWTSILKARFKPNKNVFAIANMSRFIDIYNSGGKQLAHLKTATVPAVINWHPSHNIVAGGNSSGKVFLFSEESTDDGPEYNKIKKEDAI
ncbi:hypothetical protein KAFR_0B00940 [Kazachstania africana CBS 2517]|uniref:DNA damage-binding protein CMR1 n=1 Tax=Kazachstania africana (strain ATCC 22294 / BCRC 22015 / CBS 2517 / CECT 1963 / NBRC 1671 / NRRL Y-8276) TaxID=1071382 RepID=H2APU2_KAZAF|nr:hypothetical protein KAFR_0B00940 [Kazachstania africana CBS 2517]CCF56392.1 hypothetical protein KAFR_0B00940 [Kazachstania africana CBS 2517]